MIGIIFGLIGALMMSHLLVVKFVLAEDIGSRPMLFVSILLLVVSIQFLTTGVLAELLTRTFYASGERTHHRIHWQTDPAQADWKGRASHHES